MKYLSHRQIQEALRDLQAFNPFFGITFLVLKMAKVPVGKKRRLRLDAENKKFLDTFYRAHPKSRYYFRVFRSTGKAKDWVTPKYASTSLQAVNTQTFRDAVLHDKNDTTWGWSTDYIAQLARQLPRGSVRIPVFQLAVWLYRDRSFVDDYSRADVVKEFVAEFAITDDEIDALFRTDIVSDLTEDESFQELPVRWHQILASRSRPKDVPAESSGILGYLEVDSVGPVRPLVFQPSRRLNLVTGDNGLGKTFLFDLAWWALTQHWADRQATPTDVLPSRPPYIKFAVGDTESGAIRAQYRVDTDSWSFKPQSHALSGLAVYAMVDGSFAVWDPLMRSPQRIGGAATGHGLKFTRHEIWDGRTRQLEGLIRDWVKWQQSPDVYPAYSTFEAVLRRVFPPDLGPLTIGRPVRVPNDSREIPTLQHPYGTVPVLFESAGIRRIITLAYLLVWAWEEHKIRAKQQKHPEERQMIVLIDEAEAHLHPKWQRVILPALLGIGSDLHKEMTVQWMVASHSPLVMASGESIWNNDSDTLFHLDMDEAGKVSLEISPYERRGTVDSWLSSSIFELSRPGSVEREAAIQAAVELQQHSDPTPERIRDVTALLNSHLSAEDPFWVRWIFFARSIEANP